MFSKQRGHALTRAVGLAAIALALAGIAGCSSTTSTPAPAASVAVAPEAAAIIPAPLEVTLTDTAITLVVGQEAVWPEVLSQAGSGVLTGDPTVIANVDVADGQPCRVKAVGVGTAVAKAFVDSAKAAQILKVTVVAP